MLDLAFGAEQKAGFRLSTAAKKVIEETPPRWGAVPPAKYRQVYPALLPMSGPEPLKRAFGNGTSGHSTPLVSRKSQEVLPKMYSFAPRTIEFLRALSTELDANLKVDLDKDSFTRNGLHTGFGRLKCVAGYFQTPMSFTAVDNSNYRQELGLRLNYSPEERAIATELWTLVAKEIVIASVNVQKLSTGGMRRFSKDVQWKLAFAEWLFQPENFERMLNAVWHDDWLTLANEYETLYATYIQKRGQVDDVGKDRKVFDLEYALSGGSKGRIFNTDKRVVIDGREYEDFSAIRARVVHAGPWVVNCFLQIVATCTMKSMFERFPKTFHINTAEEIKTQVDGKFVFCSDVTEYDRSMLRDAIEVPHEVMKNFWDERIVKASWRLFTSPYYSKPLDLDGREGVWVKNPTDWKQEVFAGNRSGHAWTSLMAKVNKVAESLFVINRLYPVKGRVEDFLKGNMPMGLINNGDDEIVWALVEKDLTRFKTLRADLNVGQYVVKEEVGQGFSGLLLVKPTPEPIYFPSPRLQTPFEKIYIPERPIGGDHRKYWPIGLMARVDAINATDMGREAWAIHMSVYRRILEAEHGDFSQMLMDSVAMMDLAMDSLSDKDKAVLDSPDKLHHMYDASEISDVVLNKITSKVPPEAVEKIVKRYYKGHVK